MATDKIQLNLNRQQFDSLLKIFYLGKWMLESHEDDFEIKFKREQELEQFIFAHADNDLVEFSNEFGRFLPTTKFEYEMEDTIHKYDGHIFWDELAHKLAERDLENELGKKVDKMTIEERLLGEEKHLDKYFNEFMKNGVKNLTINKD
ncbi:MAG: hypothetical protein KF816_17350 [Melioribacteraceae bacterium]|nr:hypothetical protein [Melioribacteraceae bacterium]